MKTAEQRIREQVIGKPYSDTLDVDWLGYRPVVEKDSLIIVDVVYCGPVGGEATRHQFADVVGGKIVNLGRGKDVAVIKRKPPERG
ncbi:MAG: hypothetical protein JSU63_16110 [Phycisphaerales bacterium]|nr:MAG: hypothetical protein JSU63_16110 [Phycisphaerales bacterium]